MKNPLINDTSCSWINDLIPRKNIKKGELIKEEDIIFRKPGGFLSKNDLKFVIGMRAKNDLNALNIIKWDDIEDDKTYEISSSH